MEILKRLCPQKEHQILSHLPWDCTQELIRNQLLLCGLNCLHSRDFKCINTFKVPKCNRIFGASAALSFDSILDIKFLDCNSRVLKDPKITIRYNLPLSHLFKLNFLLMYDCWNGSHIPFSIIFYPNSKKNHLVATRKLFVDTIMNQISSLIKELRNIIFLYCD